ncbi:hypothetical protein CRN76_19330 [Chryseobacterium indologenes]|nr:hypothetical protein CRN76_19330 [Chryseobacterium indologenes]AYY83871.1 hypothetical protein EGX91_04500 [Chryseobacterium indologenes]HAO28432.1 hypothetical protein [Chryseobacterium indologenes]
MKSLGGFPEPAGAQWQLNSDPPFTVLNSLLEIFFKFFINNKIFGYCFCYFSNIIKNIKKE